MGGYESRGGALARGIEAGVGLYNQINDREEARKQRQQEIDLRAQQVQDAQKQREFENQRQTTADQRQQDMDSLNAIAKQKEGLDNEYQNLVQQYGGAANVPAAQRADYWQRAHDTHDLYQTQLAKIYQPVIKQREQQASQDLSQLQSGQLDPTSMDPQRLYATLGTATRRQPTDFIPGPDGSPSKLQQAIQTIHGAISDVGPPNLDAPGVMDAINTVFQPMLQRGVGRPSQDGSPIVSKTIERLDGDPNGTGRVMPTVRVITKHNPQGYLAPLTEGVSSHPDDDNVHTFDLGDVMDYIGRTGALTNVLSQPDVANKIRDAAENGGADDVQNFINAHAQLAGKPVKRRISVSNINQGNQITQVSRDADTGAVLGKDVYPVGVNPNASVNRPQRATGIQAVLNAIDNDDSIPDEDKDQLKRDAITNAANRFGPKQKGPTNSQQDKIIEGRAAEYGIFPNGKGNWVQYQPGKDGKPGIRVPISEASAQILGRIKQEVATGGGNNGAPTQNSPAQAPMNPGDRSVGQVYMTPKGPLKWMGNGWSTAQ